MIFVRSAEDTPKTVLFAHDGEVYAPGKEVAWVKKRSWMLPWYAEAFLKGRSRKLKGKTF